MKTFLSSTLLLLWSFQAGTLSGQTPVTVRFRVDMSLERSQVKSPQTIGVRGGQAPLSWDKTHPLRDDDGDGIFTGELVFPTGIKNNLLEYKYIHDDEVWELAGQNRLLLLTGDKPEARLDVWNEMPRYNPEALPLLPVEALKEDLLILQKALSDMHPGLYRYQTPEAWDLQIREAQARLEKPLRYTEAYRFFSEVTGKIQCGHTYANFYNQSGLIKQLIFDQPDKLPFTTSIAERQLFVVKNASEHSSIARGAEILAINGVPTPDILAALLPLVKADGPNDAKRLYDLQIGGIASYEAFDAYFPLLFPPQNGRYAITLKDPRTGQESILEVAAVTRQQRREQLLQRYGPLPESFDDLWEFKFLRDSIGYLRLGSFVTYKMTLDWKKFLKDAFAAMKERRTPYLIVDIRGNEGGMDEVIYELARYLPGRPLRQPEYQTLTRYKTAPAELLPHLNSWNNRFRDFGDQVEALDNGFYRLREREQVADLPVGRSAFRGKTFLLIDAGNSSATFYLAQMAKDNRLATLVGQTTGGSRRGTNGGLMAFLTLPHSGIEVDIPLFGNFPVREEPAAGIEPDVSVVPTPAALADGIDVALEAVFHLIR